MASLGRSPGAAPLTSADIPDSSITTAKLIDSSVTSAKIGVDVIVAEDIAANAITVSEIQDDAVTADKLANSINTDIATGVAALQRSGGTMTGNIVMGDDTSIGIGDAAERIEFDGAGDISVLGANLGIGTSTPTNALLEVVTDNENIARFDGLQGNIDFRYGSDIEFDRADIVYITANNAAGELQLRTGGQNARLHIDETGNVGIGTTAPDHLLHIEQTATSGMGLLVTRNLASGSTDSPLVKIHQNHASDDQICFYVRQDCNQHAIKAFNPSNYNNTSNAFLHCGDNTASRCNIYWDGSLQNVNGTYGSGLSDERLKTNIEDVNSQWDDVKNINMVNFKLQTQGGENDFSRIGVIAQQVAGVSPNLVGERKPHPEDIRANSIFGTLYEEGDDIPKGKEIGEIKEVKENVLFFKDSIFFWKCAGALKEAMAKIETLETKVTALESA